MVKLRKYANSIERFLHGEKGQRFFNFAYSVGAAIVIWGALFKILHLPGGNVLLCVGMGTEIAMFILTAFDRPPKEYNWEDVFPVLDSKNPEDRPEFGPGGSGIVINGSGSIDVSGSGGSGVAHIGHADGAQGIHETMVEATQKYLDGIQGITEQMVQLQETTKALNEVSSVLLESFKAISENSGAISQSATGYAEQMIDLNRNIGGLNTIYEIQLKNVSGQLETIDRVNRSMKDIRDMYEKSAHESSRYCEETERMARYMKQINSVYEKMITAMTINLHNPAMGGMGAPVNPFTSQNSETEN